MDGLKLRKYRRSMNLTIEELAQKAEFTASYISQVERNLIEPSLTALSKICNVLNISPYYFLDNSNNSIVTRKEDRQILTVPDKKQEIEYLLPVTEEYKNKIKMSVYKLILNPGTWDNEKFSIIDSDKCVIILKGKLIVNFTDYNEIIEEGDSIYIGSYVPHKLFNPSDDKTELICIITC